MDIDQAARANTQEYFGVRDPDFYELQAHIIIDDGMTIGEDGRKTCNPYVNQLVSAMQDAARFLSITTTLDLITPSYIFFSLNTTIVIIIL